MRSGLFVLLTAFLISAVSYAADEMTRYDLLAPETHQFAIRYDVSATEPGSKMFFNIIRPGSEASNEKVFEKASGKELQFFLTTAKEAKAAGQAEPDLPDDTKFIKVLLPHPVPEKGEFRLCVLKTYKDTKSYYGEGETIVFERSLSVKRNVIVLPAGYELIFSSVPVIVSTEADGRRKCSMVNDRDDELAVRIVGRKLPTEKKP